MGELPPSKIYVGENSSTLKFYFLHFVNVILLKMNDVYITFDECVKTKFDRLFKH